MMSCEGWICEFIVLLVITSECKSNVESIDRVALLD